MEETKVLLRQESYAVQGAIFEVYKVMGVGFVEPVYHECLEKEFVLRGIPFIGKPGPTVTYKGSPLKQAYIPDFICFQQIINELKAVRELAPEHEAQILNYLKATGHRLGLLVNFASHPHVTIRRFVR